MFKDYYQIDQPEAGRKIKFLGPRQSLTRMFSPRGWRPKVRLQPTIEHWTMLLELWRTADQKLYSYDVVLQRHDYRDGRKRRWL